MNSEFSVLLFTGNVTHKLDPKSRVAVPSSWRAAQDGALILMDAMHDSYRVVKCYTRETFARELENIRKVATERGFDPGAISQYVGAITGQSFDAEVSVQGKLLIPKKQRERLGLTDTATLVGRSHFFEIWKPADYAASEEAARKNEIDKIFRVLG